MGSILSSAISGATMGASVGSAVPGVGTAIGAVGGALVGATTGIISNEKQKKADAMLQSGLVNPEEEAMKRYYARMRQAYQTGTAQQYQRAELQATTKQALANAFKYGGASTDIAGIKSIYLKGVLGLNEQNKQFQLANADKESQAIGDISQIKREAKMIQYTNAQLQAANDEEELGKNVNSLLSVMGTGGTAKPQDTGINPSK